VLARLRNRRFFSLAELNSAIRDCVTAINAKVMRRIGKSRNELLETIDRPALTALPTTPYSYAEWKRARVAPDYHIEVADHSRSGNLPTKRVTRHNCFHRCTTVRLRTCRIQKSRTRRPGRRRVTTKAL
jgi:hypothetical protein